jgi:hypothetical protein
MANAGVIADRAACRALLDIIEGHPTPTTMPVIVPQLIVRESTAAANGQPEQIDVRR